MTNPTSLDAAARDELARKAEAATQGRWEAGVILDNGIAGIQGDTYAVTTDRKPSAPGKIRVVALTGRAKPDVLDTQSEADAEFIAACSPDVILALLAAVRGAEAEVERLRGVLKDIAFAPMDVAPDMEAETFYRLTVGDCVRTAARALNPRAARAHPPTEEPADA